MCKLMNVCMSCCRLVFITLQGFAVEYDMLLFLMLVLEIGFLRDLRLPYFREFQIW